MAILARTDSLVTGGKKEPPPKLTIVHPLDGCLARACQSSLQPGKD